MTAEQFKQSMTDLTDVGYCFTTQGWRFQIPNARDLIYRGMRYLLKAEPQWLPAYDEIADWMTDNKGKGLLVVGHCGTGKTLICGKVIPILINCLEKKIITPYTAQELNERLEEALRKKLVYIDDVGTESELVQYGNRRNAFCELVDYAEGRKNLLIMTTNKTTEELAQKYGNRTVDRLVGITSLVTIKGDSFREYNQER